jgi:hypothetical protein
MLQRRRGLTKEEKKARKRARNKTDYNEKKAKYNEMLARNKTDLENNKSRKKLKYGSALFDLVKVAGSGRKIRWTHLKLI